MGSSLFIAAFDKTAFNLQKAYAVIEYRHVLFHRYCANKIKTCLLRKDFI